MFVGVLFMREIHHIVFYRINDMQTIIDIDSKSKLSVRSIFWFWRRNDCF